MTSNGTLLAILAELTADAHLIKDTQVQAFTDIIHAAPRVFVAGAGRSGFAARAFANRLAHTGKLTWFVGEPTTPPITHGDLLIVGSGSGETGSLVTMVRKAKSLGANIATLTIHPENAIGALADIVVEIPGVTAKSGKDGGARDSVQMTGSSFEQLSWITYDTVIVALRDRTGQNNDELFARHANLE